jgi:hypothetical protein
MASAAKRYVDMWAFLGLHPTNLDILQRLKSADDRQFGTHMDVCGTISQLDSKTGNWEEICLAALRSDIWNPDESEMKRSLSALKAERRKQLRKSTKKSTRLSAGQDTRLTKTPSQDEIAALCADDIEKRRLVMKLFRTTGERIRWTGTMEEVTTREVHNSIASKRPVLSMVSILAGYEYLTSVQENHRTFRIPSIYTLCFYDEAHSRVWYVNIKRKWFSLGADFVIESEGRQIGEIDGKLIGFGYNAYVTVTEPTLAANGDFMDLVTLFATTVGYHRAMRRSVRRRVAATCEGNTQLHVIEDEEFWLLKNPRRRAA